MEISELNQLFLDSNQKARKEIIKSQSLILVLSNDTLYIQHNTPDYNVFESKKLELETYHTVKTICHFISGLHLGLINLHSSEDKKRMVDLLSNFVESRKELFVVEGVKYWRGLVKMLNVNDKLEIDHSVISLAMKHCAEMYQTELHRVVQEVRNDYSKEEPEWPNDFLVIVTGPPSPRPGHSAMQYFSRLTGKTQLVSDRHFALGPILRSVLDPDTEFEKPQLVSTHLFGDPIQEEKNETEEISLEEVKRKRDRKLYYVENITVNDRDGYLTVLDIVAQQILERQQYDRIVDMRTDILAYDTKKYLSTVCKK